MLYPKTLTYGMDGRCDGCTDGHTYVLYIQLTICCSYKLLPECMFSEVCLVQPLWVKPWQLLLWANSYLNKCSDKGNASVTSRHLGNYDRPTDQPIDWSTDGHEKWQFLYKSLSASLVFKILFWFHKKCLASKYRRHGGVWPCCSRDWTWSWVREGGCEGARK